VTRPIVATIRASKKAHSLSYAGETVRSARYHVDEAYLWLEQESSIMLKAVSSYGDPLELTAHDGRQLAEVLVRLAEALDAD